MPPGRRGRRGKPRAGILPRLLQEAHHFLEWSARHLSVYHRHRGIACPGSEPSGGARSRGGFPGPIRPASAVSCRLRAADVAGGAVTGGSPCMRRVREAAEKVATSSSERECSVAQDVGECFLREIAEGVLRLLQDGISEPCCLHPVDEGVNCGEAESTRLPPWSSFRPTKGHRPREVRPAGSARVSCARAVRGAASGLPQANRPPGVPARRGPRRGSGGSARWG